MMARVHGKQSRIPRRAQAKPALYLGVECGGTRTSACLAGASGRVIKDRTFGPANLKLLTGARLAALLRSIQAAFPSPDAIAIGMAGARTESDRSRVRQAAAAGGG